MKAESLTKENVVYFFNKYKYNSDVIYNVERKLLKESYDFQKWEKFRSESSELTRKYFDENKKLIEEYVNPAIQNPEKLNSETLKTFLLHITFFLFENNIDSHIVDDFLESLLNHKELLTPQIYFSALMNLGISKTVSLSDTFENSIGYFEKAVEIFPHLSDAPDYDTQIHIVFCRVYEMLAFCLYQSADYKLFADIYEKTEKMLSEGTPELFSKMWGKGADFEFHVEYLKRFLRLYGIFAAGQNLFEEKNVSESKNNSAGTENVSSELKNNFSESGSVSSEAKSTFSETKNFSSKMQNAFSEEKNSFSESQNALRTICVWLRDEYFLEEAEGEINLMVFSYYQIMREKSGEISKDALVQIFHRKFEEFRSLPELERNRVYPSLAFPDDADPVNLKFSKMLEKMKIFNSSFSYLFVFLQNFLSLNDDTKENKKIIQEIVNEFEKCRYTQKGFSTDKFSVDLIKIVAEKFSNEKEFLLFIQSIFVHRQFSTTIHLGMVNSLAGICVYRILNERPDLCVVPGIFPTEKDVLENKFEILKMIKSAALLHDVGKVRLSRLVNLQFRPITEKEFERLKKHTTFGKKIVENIPYLERYSDFVEGHHKFWNDEQGYPENFKVQDSPYKNLVNLISICDMIDTATDSKGRNYNKTLTFEEMLEDLRLCSGTRYNPELVNFILSNEELLKELNEILSEGRDFNSFQTYQNFVQPNTSFSAKDEKSVDSVNDFYKEKLPAFYKSCFPLADENRIKNHIEEILEGKYSRIFVLHDSCGTIFGVFAGRIKNPLDSESSFFVDEIIVHPEHRRFGLGTELMNFAEQKLAEEKIAKIRMATVNNFDIDSFFWILGFSQTPQFLMEKNIS